MSPDDERAIERFVRHPDTMEAAARRAVERLIEHDPGASAYATFLRGFYDRLDEETERPPDTRVEAFVEELFDKSDASVIPVRPLSSSQGARPTVLAASTATRSDERRYAVLSTLAAESEQMLVRIVQDRHASRGHLYVLADPPERGAYVVVSFRELGIDLVADAQGRRAFDLPSNVSPEQWADARAVVRRPIATAEAAPSATTVVPLPGRERVRCRRRGEALEASVEAAGEQRAALLAATSPNGSPMLLRLQSGAPARGTVDPASSLTLRVYE